MMNQAMTQERSSNFNQLGSETYDVVIIGGGINGATSAAALAAKGFALKVPPWPERPKRFHSESL